MHLGLSSYIFRYAALAEYTAPEAALTPLTLTLTLLQQAASLGAEAVQFCENVPLHLLDERGLAELARTSASSGVRVHVGTAGLEMEHLARYVDLAARFGSPYLRLVPGSGEASDVEHALRQVLPYCAHRRVTLALENHFDLSSEQMVAIVQRIADPHLAICLDVANSIGLLEKPLDTVRTLAPYAVQVHLKDYTLRCPGVGFVIQGAPLGQGDLPIDAVMATLSHLDDDIYVYLEQWLPPQETHQATLHWERRWIEESIIFAQSLL